MKIDDINNEVEKLADIFLKEELQIASISTSRAVKLGFVEGYNKAKTNYEVESSVRELHQYKIGLEDGYNKSIANSQFTISDDVLFEQATIAMEEVYGYGCETEIDAYFRGAKWILKQTNK